MSTVMRETSGGAFRTTSRAWQDGRIAPWWSAHRETALSWLALGVLLAAWNAADDDATRLSPRPDALRRHPYVSVRAATLHAAELRATFTKQ
jgi:hypothetical protein